MQFPVDTVSMAFSRFFRSFLVCIRKFQFQIKGYLFFQKLRQLFFLRKGSLCLHFRRFKLFFQFSQFPLLIFQILRYLLCEILQPCDVSQCRFTGIHLITAFPFQAEEYILKCSSFQHYL